MKIEVIEAEGDTALNIEGVGELWVRVLSDDPLGPEGWEKLRPTLDASLFLTEGEGAGNYDMRPSTYYADLDIGADGEGEDDPWEGYSHEQWYICKKRGH